MMATATKIAAAKAAPGRVGQVSAPTATASGANGLFGRPQVNSTGGLFWSMGSPLCASLNPHPYPTLEE